MWACSRITLSRNNSIFPMDPLFCQVLSVKRWFRKGQHSSSPLTFEYSKKTASLVGRSHIENGKARWPIKTCNGGGDAKVVCLCLPPPYLDHCLFTGTGCSVKWHCQKCFSILSMLTPRWSSLIQVMQYSFTSARGLSWSTTVIFLPSGLYRLYSHLSCMARKTCQICVAIGPALDLFGSARQRWFLLMTGIQLKMRWNLHVLNVSKFISYLSVLLHLLQLIIPSLLGGLFIKKISPLSLAF